MHTPRTPVDILPPDVLAELRESVDGVVRADPCTRGAYATDASLYQILPAAVIEPLDRENLLAAVRICARHRIPMLPRGGGTSLSGQTVNHGVVLDVSRSCNRILEINPAGRWARVEPGVVRESLNRALRPHRLHFAPDPATANRANIGGMIASNAAGMRSLQYGMTIDHVLGVDLALASGDTVTLGPVSEADFHAAGQDARGRILRGVRTVIDREREEILARFPRVGRRSGGYPLDAFTGPLPWNLARLVAGSEGTLGVILEATVRLEPLPLHSGLCLAHFQRLGDALRAVADIVKCGPSAVELLDGIILRQARQHPLTAHTCRRIEGDPDALLIIEARHDDPSEVRRVLTAVSESVRASGRSAYAPILDAPHDVEAVWLMRESALGLMTTVRGDRKPTPYIEDAAVPLDVLPEYVEAVLDVCQRHQQPVSLFAHAGAGLLHIRPLHDLHEPTDVEQMLRIQEEVFELVLRYGGAWSGEHGDGIIRGGFNRRFFGDRLFAAFREIKQVFDPAGLMNPGKVLDPPPRDRNLRYSPPYRADPLATAFHWRDEGDLLRAAEQCTGIGACRKLQSGVMCPSYMATRDELHSTRGRANVLRLALSGQLGRDALRGEDLHAIFDRCLSCKGCKHECPNGVDVGKMKAELLHHYYQAHRRPLRSQLFLRAAQLGTWQSGRPAPAVNALLASRPVRALLDRLLGIDARRPLPHYARQPLGAWIKRRPSRTPRAQARRVVLFRDLYMEYHEPEVGQAAARVLEAAGFEIAWFGPADSQRPALSQGALDTARAGGLQLFRRLAETGDADTPILVVEPSCATALLQDLPELIPDSDLAQRVASRVLQLEVFLARELEAGRFACDCPTPDSPIDVLVHPHCHQRVLDNGRAFRQLLAAVPGVTVRESGAGCCGMAGAFGYEKDHYDLSVTIAEDRLLPAIRSCGPSTRIVAGGFSCRHQIRDLSGRTAEAPIVLLDALRFPTGTPRPPSGT